MKYGRLYILLFFIFIQCTDIKNTKDENETSVSDFEVKKQINVQNFFNTLPSATDIYEIIQQSRLNYNPDFLNNPTKHKNYSLEKPRALNLGVYGTNLAISAAFNQVQESMLFLKCTNYLAQELGVSSAFDESTMNRLEINKENRDSVLQIISQAFKKSDKIFSGNKRQQLSILMIAGAYLEGMYVAGEYILSKKEDTLAVKTPLNLYFQQKEALSYLLELLQINMEAEEKNLIEKLKDVHRLLNQSPASIEQFINAHQIVSDLRKQIVNVY